MSNIITEFPFNAIQYLNELLLMFYDDYFVCHQCFSLMYVNITCGCKKCQNNELFKKKIGLSTYYEFHLNFGIDCDGVVGKCDHGYNIYPDCIDFGDHIKIGSCCD